MADPVLHIKDAYFFEVPKALWRYDYQDYDQVPAKFDFLKADAKEHHLSIADFNKELSGKIVIPQPVAKLKSLYEAESGFAISKYMILELVAAAIVAFVFIRLANRMAKETTPKGRVSNLLESMLLFVRDQVVRPAIGETHHDHDHNPGDHSHDTDGVDAVGAHSGSSDGHHHEHHANGKVGHSADRMLPLFWTMFFFILTCNLLGLIPWLGAPTSAFGATFAFACVTFCTTLLMGMMTFGPLKFWWYQVPSMDLPWYLWWLKLVILTIELLGLCIKHAILSVRLLANMVAGHLVLLGIMGLIVGAASASTGIWGTTMTISVVGSTLFSCLELLVAFLQAYIFTFLSALFIGAAMHRH